MFKNSFNNLSRVTNTTLSIGTRLKSSHKKSRLAKAAGCSSEAPVSSAHNLFRTIQLILSDKQVPNNLNSIHLQLQDIVFY